MTNVSVVNNILSKTCLAIKQSWDPGNGYITMNTEHLENFEVNDQIQRQYHWQPKRGPCDGSLYEDTGHKAMASWVPSLGTIL